MTGRHAQIFKGIWELGSPLQYKQFLSCLAEGISEHILPRWMRGVLYTFPVQADCSYWA